MRGVDWSATAVGPVSSWPQSLRTAIGILLDNSFGMAVAWGPDYIFFYNDAYRPILGSTKHPSAMGRPIARIFPEIWHIIGPMFDAVMRGQTFGWDDWRLPLDRHGFTEECFFTFSYSPIRAESGGVGGVLVTVSEITARVLGERRMQLLRDLAAQTAEARADEEACRIAAGALAEEPWDIPFAQIYLFDREGGPLRLVAACGDAAVERRDWPAEETIQDVTELEIVHRDDFGSAPVRQAVVLPIAKHGDSGPAGVLVAGVSPRLRFDDSYRDFLHLVANQIATAVANARAYTALAELDRAKTIFFNNVSHEFRTPLTLLLGPLEDVLKRDALPPADRESIEVAQRNAMRLLKLVNTLLEFSRIEAGRIEASYEPTDLAALTQELASVFRSAIEGAGLELRVRCEPLPEPVYVDREMWEKIVFNLLSNAFKFTFEGAIEVTLQRVDDDVELRVRDSGVGIPASELPNMFNRFHRVRGTRARSNEGTGIGLALVQELVRMHAGRVTVESRENQGSTFAVRIPLGRAHLPQDRISAPRLLTPTNIGPRPFLDDFEQWMPRPTSKAIDAATGGARVLVVDDNSDIRDYVCRVLAKQWTVDSATDGADALQRIRSRKPDLVVTDIMMPVMDGFELLQVIRGDEALRDLPVILLSARAGDEARVEGLDAGADDYLIKPFSAAELTARVGSHLRLAAMRRETGERINGILNSITDAFAFVDRNWTLRMLNAKAEEIVGRNAADVLGTNVWQTFGEIAGTPFETAFLKAMNERVPQRVEEFFAPYGKWIEVYVYPSDDGLSFFFRDVTERFLTAAALSESEQRYRRLAQELEIANRAKDEFLTTLSHELRTPMTATLGWATMLRLGHDETLDWRPAIDAIEQSTRAQAKLIDDILDVSRISTGKLQLHIEPVALEDIVESAASTVRQIAESKGLQVETQVEKLRGSVLGDADRLGQIVRNLLSNAMKFTPAGGRIRVELDQDESCARIRVRDTGEGITPDFLPFVFDRFRQAQSGSTRRHGGLGIGLSIVRDLVELHGGTVVAASDGPGKGAVFTIHLPLVADTSLHIIDERQRDTIRLDGIPILIVEDDEPTRAMLRAALTRFGATVATATSVAEALSMLAQDGRSIIVSDIAMPGEDGFSLIARLRAQNGEQRNRLIALTANARNEDRERVMAAGFDAFIAKPVDLDVLAAEVRRLAVR